ncbi:MAG: diacylglycerol kinase family lipid kinase [Kiritimatiellales bacterium]|nr:diacylglycerol kinase family lipid kinase [Kiritimatiellota bacterium]MBL7011973.1 diacylglycerol kinase family lipid kinase [Kiritimatiellales bacterium]
MSTDQKKVRILINPNSGLGNTLDQVRDALLEHWDLPGIDLTMQFSKSKEDGQNKARRAVDEGVSVVLVMGGDGMVNTIGSVLVGTNVALGVIPTGSGNGFARHFDIPLNIKKATIALANARIQPIDVGFANDQPFFVTCSLAWDAALVKGFEKSPVRGILPYVFAGVYEFFEYSPQPFTFLIDETEELYIADPILCTIANLTQFGGGAQIAPDAKPDDGKLQLITIRKKHFAKVLPMIGKVFDGTINSLKEIETHSFQTLTVRRKKEGPMQLDGELLSAPSEVHIRVEPRALNVLVP